MKEQPIQQFLQNQTNLVASLQEKLAHLQKLNVIWQKYIDFNLAKHTRVANWRDNKLIIEVDSAAWVTHVRYSLSELLRKLKQEPELAGLRQINWYIQPAQNPARKKSRPAIKLSAENSAMLCDIAEHVSNEKLKKALLALAQNNVTCE